MIKKNYMDKIYMIGSNFILSALLILSAVLILSAIDNYGSAYAQENTEFTATLSGKEVIPPVKTDGTGIANFEVGENSLSYQINVLNAGKITSVQINHGAVGTNGEAIVTLIESKGDDDVNLIDNIPTLTGIASTKQSSSSFSASGNVNVADLTGPFKDKTIADLVIAMQSGETYVNVKTEDHPEGELRGQISEAD
jgi:CHRD domain